MTIQQAKKLKWGTMLRPSKHQHEVFRNSKRYPRDAIFLGVSRDGLALVVVAIGTKTVSTWHPMFWMAKPEVKHGV